MTPLKQQRPRGTNGVSLVEVAVTVAILSLLISGALSLFSQPMAAKREDETIGKLIALKRAIVGDPRIVTREARTDFGVSRRHRFPPGNVG